MTDILLRAYQRMPTPARSLAASLRGLYLRSWRYGSETERLVEAAVAREYWSPERWRAWRDERLAYVLHRAATRVPYYRGAWEERRRRGDRASWECLENWPILEKSALVGRAAAFVADDVDMRRMYRDHTSGTTGTSLDVWLTRGTVRGWFALFEARTRRWNGLTRHDRWAILGGQPIVPARVRRPPFWVWNAPMHQLYMSTNHLGIETAAAYLDALRRYGITHVIAYPSAASVLAHHARQQGTMVPGLRVAFANAEPLYPWQRAVIETGLGCAVRETYGMVEIAAAASECAKGALHLWPEAGHLEVLDDGADTPASAGKAGRFVCTGLFNVDMPLVRYAVGDRGMVNAERSCGCGRTLPVVASLEGRTTDTLVTPDGRSVHWVNPIFYGLPVLEGQVAQETVDRVRITVAPAPGFRDAHVAMLVERLRIRMGDVHVDVDQVRAIPRALNGKFRAVVCNVPRGERTRVVREPC